jgi:hypothetical protein
MTSQVARLYALVAAVAVFFVAWATVAAHPWRTHTAAATDPRVAALQLREQRVRAESLAVKRVVDRRWAAYRAKLSARRQQTAQLVSSAPAVAAPPVRVVTLPPVTITRTS